MFKLFNKKYLEEYSSPNSSENLKMQVLDNFKNTDLKIENLNEDVKKLKIENIFKVDNAYIANIDLKIEKLNTGFKKLNQENQDLVDGIEKLNEDIEKINEDIEKLKSQNKSLTHVNKMVMILLIVISLFNVSTR